MRSILARFRRPYIAGLPEQLMLMNSTGDGSTLSLDFTTGVLDPRLTFTRSTSGTYIGSDGLVKTMAAAPTNDPTKARFDYDPTTLAPRGLLIEGSANNLCTWSQDFSNANWLPDNGSAANPDVYVVSQTAPDGSSSVNRITFNKTGGTFSRVRQTLSGTAGATYTFSVWMKANTASGGASTQNVGLRIGADPAGFNCVVTTTWKRFSYSYALSGTDAAAQIMLWDNIVGNDETADVLVWGAQLETGSGASSYIPTGASQGTRSRDEVVLSSLPGIAFNQSAGTMYSQLEIIEKLRGSFVPYGSFDTSGGGRCWWWLRHNHDASVGQRILGTAFNSGGSTSITSSNYTHSSGVFKFATSLDPIAGRMVYAIAGGSAQVTNASGFTLATAAQMSLNKNNDVATTDLGSMWVRTIKYWPTALPDAQLQSITT